MIVRAGAKATTTATFAALLLAGCGSEAGSDGSGTDGSGEYRIDEESGETSMTIDTPDGAVSMRTGSDVELDLPRGFSLPDGAQVVQNTVVNQSDGKGTLVTFTTDITPVEVADFYREQAESAGVDVQLDASINEGRMLGGEGPGGLTFSLSANPDEGGKTTAQLVVGVGDDY